MLAGPGGTNHVEPLGREFYLSRLRQAVAHRDRIVVGSSAYRLVSSEADLLPGLIVDRYGAYLVMQTLNQGMDRDRDLIASCLDELLSPVAIVARNDASVRKLEDLPLETVVLKGEVPDSVPITMNGLELRGDLLRGHKTGIYLDQRENYVAATQHVPAHEHARVLDCFSSTGGFALHLAGKVEAVDAVESSTAAIEIAQANARRNSIQNIQFHQADAFEFLSGAAGAGKRYDLIVLDPPAFAKSRRSLDDAVRGYKEINLRALKLLGPGGVLVTCSCSHHMNEGIFLETVAAAALDAGRTLRVLERRTQAADHPILLTVPETLYLKCAILEVVANSR